MPTLHRFFVPPAAIQGQQVHFAAEQARQMRTVLRLRPGDEVAALDGGGRCLRVSLQHLGKNEAHGRVLQAVPLTGEPSGDIVLYLAMIRSDRFEWVLQKGVELGVTRFVPLITRRTVRKPPGAVKEARWQRILQEAAEQSQRGRIPELAASQNFAQAISGAAGAVLLPAVAATRPVSQALASLAWPVSILIGPEGGFDPQEVAQARGAGIEPVGLGPRILRTETAAVALLALANLALGELAALPSASTQVA